ncbi:MAG: phosphate--acyl-ACP acyltransferase, partial [Clostridia bacterium]|nr:phosphate--acyl-ACP acyltransferase [Clostridia bacterium]
MKLVIDTFGGDNAPQCVVDAVCTALKNDPELRFILTGAKQVLESAFAGTGSDMSRVQIVDAPDVITCDEQPTVAVKRKKQSSLVAAMDVMARHEADCLISAGSTGAVLTAATLIVRRIPGVKRPALAPVMPTAE